MTGLGVFLGALFSVLIAVPLAVLAAARRDRPTDHVIRAVPLVGLGFPYLAGHLVDAVLLRLREGVPAEERERELYQILALYRLYRTYGEELDRLIDARARAAGIVRLHVGSSADPATHRTVKV